MEQNSFSNDSKPRKTPREIKWHLRVRFKDSKKKRSVIEEEAKFDPESSAEKPRKTPDEIKRHLRVKFTSSKKSLDLGHKSRNQGHGKISKSTFVSNILAPRTKAISKIGSQDE